ELTQAEKGVAAAVLGRQAHYFPEHVAAFGELVERVVGRPLIPEAFDVVGLDLHGSGIEVDGVFPPFGLPGLGGSLDELVELGARGRADRRLLRGRGARLLRCWRT